MEIADSVAPDAIILDMRMPITNGLQFLRLIRSQAASRRGASRYRHGRLLSGRCHTERAAIARRLDPVQAHVPRGPADPRPHDGFLACPIGSSARAGSSRWTPRRSGSCVRPAATFRSTARSARSTRCSSSAAQPELAVTVTLQPLDVIELDAAILFSDLLLPFTPMGLEFDFVKGEGPSIANPVRSAADVARLDDVRARGARARARDDPAPAPRARRTRAADRLRRRAVHHGRLRHRGRAVAGLSPHQDVHVRAARELASALRALRRRR